MAGGKSSRMGTDKSWVEINGKPMINRVIDIIKPQVDEIIINANGDKWQYEKLGFQVYPDKIDGFCGPLSGVLAGLEHSNNDIVLSVPVDCPLLPNDLVDKMLKKFESNTDVVVASSNSRNHPVIALWRKSLQGQLQQAINNGIYKVDLFTQNLYCESVDFDDYEYDVFTNVNTVEDIKKVSGYIND